MTRRSRVMAWAALAVAPLPVIVALVLTQRPEYPDDACYEFRGRDPVAVQETADYLALMAPLAMYGFALALTIAARTRTRWWRIVGAVAFAWAALSLVWTEASHPIMYPGGLFALLGIFTVPIAVAVAWAVGRETDYLPAIAWFEAVFLIPALLGLAKVLAQPACLP